MASGMFVDGVVVYHLNALPLSIPPGKSIQWALQCSWTMSGTIDYKVWEGEN